MTAVLPHRWTIAEYRQLDKTGLFTDRKTMLLNGEIFASSMPSPMHSTAAAKVGNHLRGLFPTNPHVRVEKALDIGTENDPGPDLAVVSGTLDDYMTRHPSTAGLVVEVAVSSLESDLHLKAELYAAAKVPEYWVLDVDGRELHVLRDPVTHPAGREVNAYRTHETIAATGTVAPLAAPNATIKIEALLPMVKSQ